MNSEKFYKQVWVVCILLFVCVIVNFAFSFTGTGMSDVNLKTELTNAQTQIELLEREISSLSDYVADMELAASGESKSITLDLLEARLALLETASANTTDAAMARRMEQLEMKLSTLEIAFKQANNISTAGASNKAPAASASTNKTPATSNKAATTTPANTNKTPATSNKAATTTPANTNKTPAASNKAATGSGQPIQIQTGSGSGGGTAVATNSKFHTVQTGETLFRISRTYGITVDQLRKMNNLKENDVIKPGQRLIVGQ